MSEPHPTAPARPSKPSPDFPLFPHAAGVWAKKIRGKMYYFGPWSDPDGALAKYLAQKDALHAGRKPREAAAGVTVKDAANAFLNHKQARLDTGELSARTFAEYRETCNLIVSEFGKRRLLDDLDAADFTALRDKLAKKWGPVRLGNAVQRVRSVFKHALDAGLVDRPVRFGPGLTRPSAKVLRLHRAKQGAKLFTAAEVRSLIAAAAQPLKAMLLLGANAGFGMADCGALPVSALDLAAAWVSFPRPKTGIPRRCALWPETVDALKEALKKRPEPKDPADAGLVFLTRQGRPWAKATASSPAVYKVSALMRRLAINGRKGLGFYTLRHVFRTVADEAKDQPAADFIMGHARDDMASVYRERIGDERLKAVAEHVRAWLFPLKKTKAKK
ncbi:MAG TPA: tyrosine-type recombinase/integrase [Gemmataceae bacterium]|nr:tyrosine-type recombinase/integrase [Gemmataceae bacterium]